jgi:hypothetical protein
MTMDKIEGNKLIAEFVQFIEGIGWVTKYPFTNDKLKFHSSWDWLMPVVELTNVICEFASYELSNNSREQEHLENKLDNPNHWKSWSYHHVRLDADIGYVWNKVVQFIQRYNSQQPKKQGE